MLALYLERSCIMTTLVLAQSSVPNFWSLLGTSKDLSVEELVGGP
jgi:hypothetical protein